MVTTEYSLENIPWIRRSIPWIIFHGYDGLFPGQIKFYFSRGRPLTREFPGEYSMVTKGYSLVKSNLLFQKGALPTREFPREYSMVTTGYSLVKSNFISQRDPPAMREFPVEYSMVTTGYSLVKANLIFKMAPPHGRIPSRIFHGHNVVFAGQIKFYFTKGTPPSENSLENISWSRRGIS